MTFKITIPRHPREPQRTPLEIYENIRQVFQKRAQRRTRLDRYTLFDYLHDFRIWANYLDIDNLLSLRGEGYKSLLNKKSSPDPIFRWRYSGNPLHLPFWRRAIP